MYLTIIELIQEINNNNYSIICISGIIEFKMILRNINTKEDKDSIYFSELNTTHIKINKHQIMKILKETNKIIIVLDNFLQIYILKDKNIP